MITSDNNTMKLAVIFTTFLLFFSALAGENKSKQANSVGLQTVQKIEKNSLNFAISMIARRFAQGEVILVKLKEKSPVRRISVIWTGKEYEVAKYDDGYISIIPVHPEFKDTQGEVKITYWKGFRKFKETYSVSIEKTAFKEYGNITLNKKFTENKYSKKTLDFIHKCTLYKQKAFSHLRELYLKGNFVFPVKSKKVNSNFYARRTYNNVKGSPHRGVDLSGKKDDPIFAIQDGKVELARKMYFEGNLTIINHGNDIFSLYMHQSKTMVKEGDVVKKGDLIGKIGSTGMSSGPHLHLSLKVKDVYVDPMSLISLNVF